MQDRVQQRGRVQSAPHLRLLTWEGSDAELLELVALRDETAAARFHDRFGSDVHALVLALVGHHQAHERLVTKSLLGAFAGLYTSDVSAGQLPAWVARHTVRVVRGHLRARRWLGLLSGRKRAQALGSLAVVYDRLGRLPSDVQLAFCLRYVAGRALSDSALLSECSVQDIRERLKHAEDHLAGVAPSLLHEVPAEIVWED